MLQQPTLAIIEDNNDLQEELSFFLKAKGYECWTATSAEEFWRKLHLQKALLRLGAVKKTTLMA